MQLRYRRCLSLFIDLTSGLLLLLQERDTGIEEYGCVGVGGCKETPWKEVAGIKDPEPKARAVAEGFHFSAEGPGGAAAGPRAGTCDEGRWPEGRDA